MILRYFHKAFITFLIVFIIGLIMYMPTVKSSIGWYNSGELVSAALTLDVPHSPGYPLFTRLANLVLQIPMDAEPAYNVNLLTAIFGILGAALLGFYLNIAGYSTFSSISASILLLSCSIYWEQSVLAEVYTLEVCFIMLGLIIGKLIENGHESNFLAFFAGMIGMLGVGHRPTFGLYTISLFFFVSQKKTTFKNLSKFIIFMLVGVVVGSVPSFDLYLRLQSYNRVLLDPLIGRGLSGFIKVFTGTVYKSGLFAFSIPEILARFKSLILLFFAQGTLAILFIPAFVIAKKYKNLSSDIKAMLWILLVNIFFVINYNAFQTDTMLLPSLTALCILTGIGFDLVKKQLWAKSAILIFLLFVGVNGYLDASLNRNNIDPIKYVFRMAKLLPRGSVLMLSNDVEFRPFWYLRQTNKFRPDIGIQLVDNIENKDLISLSTFVKSNRLFGSLVYPDDAKQKLVASYSLQSLGYVCNVYTSTNEQKLKNQGLEVLETQALSDKSKLNIMADSRHVSLGNNNDKVRAGDILLYSYQYQGAYADFKRLVVVTLLVNSKGEVLSRNNIMVGHDIHMPSNYLKKNITEMKSITIDNRSSIVIPYDLKPGKFKLISSSFLCNEGIPTEWLNLEKSIISPFNYYGYLEVFSLKYGLSYRHLIKNMKISKLIQTDNINFGPFATINEISVQK